MAWGRKFGIQSFCNYPRNFFQEWNLETLLVGRELTLSLFGKQGLQYLMPLWTGSEISLAMDQRGLLVTHQSVTHGD